MNQRADSGKKNLSGVALRPRNNKACWLLSHTASQDRDAAPCETPLARAFVRFLSNKRDDATLPRKPAGDSFPSRTGRNYSKPAQRCANKTSPVAGAELMPGMTQASSKGALRPAQNDSAFFFLVAFGAGLALVLVV